MIRTPRPYPTTDPGMTPNERDTSPTDHRRTDMYTMHEALARERTREGQRRSHDAQLARELVAQRRWHRVSLRAHAAQERHTRRVEQLQAR